MIDRKKQKQKLVNGFKVRQRIGKENIFIKSRIHIPMVKSKISFIQN